MGSDLEVGLVAQAWAALTSQEEAGQSQAPDRLEVVGPSGHLPSPFPVEETAVACVAAALLAAVSVHEQRGGSVGRVTLDRSHVAAAVRSERYFRRGGVSAGAGFAALSRFWRTGDGWVRTHANYPWHRAALLSALGADPDAVADAMAGLAAEEVEARVFAAGGIAAAVRPLEAWRDHAQGKALVGEPLVAHRAVGDAGPRIRPVSERPASGVRVLDLTRVIAGPVCTRYLGALGADVLRLDPPDLPDMRPGESTDTLLGKRSARLDLRSDAGAAALARLLAEADVVVCGYRPGALDRFGLSEEALAERHRGLVVVYLDAWGHGGPWAGRRGFDSIVQAATGIAVGESAGGGEPGALPCQLLDHGTGYLAAAAALDGLRRQADQGGSHIRRLSLARTAWWLTSVPTSGQGPSDPPTGAADSPPWLAEVDSARGSVTAVTPPGGIDGRPLRWPSPLTGYGDDAPAWPDHDQAGLGK